MNDFTKDELLELESCLIFKMDRFLPTPTKITHDLIDKIQSMIDNYCEHEKIGQVSDVDYVNICTACKELTGWV